MEKRRKLSPYNVFVSSMGDWQKNWNIVEESLTRLSKIMGFIAWTDSFSYF